MTVEIPLSRGFAAVVDDEDAASVLAAGPWHANTRGRTTYAQHNVRRREGGWTTQSLHTFLTGWRLVDHIDCDGLNNQRSNLREATHRLNAANRAARNDSTTGYKGVQRHPSARRPWRAQITVDGLTRHLGLFETADQAARAYDAAASESWGEFAHLNFRQETAA